MSQIGLVTFEIGGRPLTLETGEVAKQASGTVVVKQGDTVVLVTATMSPLTRTDIDFFPLTVDFEERKYAVGKIPGGFSKRGGRPSDETIVKARLIDRAIRPLFPKGMRNEVQVIVLPFSVDYQNPPEVLGLIGASAALSLSPIPWGGPIGAVRVGRVEGEFILNPGSELLERSDLDLVVASLRDHVIMIEADADQLPEEVLLAAIDLAHQHNQKVIEAIEELTRRAGQPKAEVPLFLVSDELKQAVKEQAGEAIRAAIQNPDKAARELGLIQLKEEIIAQLTTAPGEPGQAETPVSPDEGRELELRAAIDEIVKEEVRRLVLKEGKRPDGRQDREIRPIQCAVGVLPRTHGSGLFQRGQTQLLTTCTLGALEEAQILDSLQEEESKRFMHFYNFLPFSTGETRPLRGAGRREIGHGMLAERALARLIPNEEEFPYTILLYSEVLESNGSTSMASVCSSSLALMDAGVPIKAAAAGIAHGLVLEGDQYVLLTDIQGMEDQCGDMDFKVAGTSQGITAVQLDLKIPGLPRPILEETLYRAREARLAILEKMRAVIPAPRAELSPLAPRIFVMEIHPDKIGDVIGPGGRIIKKIIAETNTQIQIEQDGRIYIAAPNVESGERARRMIEALVQEVTVGQVYPGRVTRLVPFGAFVEILPGKEGLVSVADISDRRIRRPEELLKVGDEILVRVKEIDSLGRINLTARGLEQKLESLRSATSEAAMGTAHAPSRLASPRPPLPPREGKRPPRHEEDLPKPLFRPKR